MKNRTGFVSNSSSSSFIVGVAEVIDNNKLNSYVLERGIKYDSDFKVTTIGEIKSNAFWDIKYNNGKIRVSSFQTDVSLNIGEKPDDTKIVYVNISNDEGDYAFIEDEDWGDLNYDIDLDYFDDKQQDIYSVFTSGNSGINNADITFGAARNG